MRCFGLGIPYFFFYNYFLPLLNSDASNIVSAQIGINSLWFFKTQIEIDPNTSVIFSVVGITFRITKLYLLPILLQALTKSAYNLSHSQQIGLIPSSNYLKPHSPQSLNYSLVIRWALTVGYKLLQRLSRGYLVHIGCQILDYYCTK